MGTLDFIKKRTVDGLTCTYESMNFENLNIDHYEVKQSILL